MSAAEKLTHEHFDQNRKEEFFDALLSFSNRYRNESGRKSLEDK